MKTETGTAAPGWRSWKSHEALRRPIGFARWMRGLRIVIIAIVGAKIAILIYWKRFGHIRFIDAVRAMNSYFSPYIIRRYALDVVADPDVELEIAAHYGADRIPWGLLTEHLVSDCRRRLDGRDRFRIGYYLPFTTSGEDDDSLPGLRDYELELVAAGVFVDGYISTGDFSAARFMEIHPKQGFEFHGRMRSHDIRRLWLRLAGGPRLSVADVNAIADDETKIVRSRRAGITKKRKEK